jgi:hypothetical protein
MRCDAVHRRSRSLVDVDDGPVVENEEQGDRCACAASWSKMVPAQVRKGYQRFRTAKSRDSGFVTAKQELEEAL